MYNVFPFLAAKSIFFVLLATMTHFKKVYITPYHYNSHYNSILLDLFYTYLGNILVAHEQTLV